MKKRTAYLEKCGEEWFDDFVYLAREPLLKRGFIITPFDGLKLDEFINSKVFTIDDILLGSVESTSKFFEEIGVKTPKYLGYPKSLEKYLGRDIVDGKISQLKIYNPPIFIKPKNEVKLFTGFLLENKTTLDNLKFYYPNIEDDTEIYISEPINILSEYRCFINNGIMVGMKHYDGDYTLFPDVDVIRQMIFDYGMIEAPISYSLDVAILDNGKTVLVEINDFWAIGGYGLDGKTYVKLFIDRMNQIKEPIIIKQYQEELIKENDEDLLNTEKVLNEIKEIVSEEYFNAIQEFLADDENGVYGFLKIVDKPIGEYQSEEGDYWDILKGLYIDQSCGYSGDDYHGTLEIKITEDKFLRCSFSL